MSGNGGRRGPSFVDGGRTALALSDAPMEGPSDHLLRTFGAVPAASRVLDLGCGRGVHTRPLMELGLDVFACDSSPEAVRAVRSRIYEDAGKREARGRCSISRLDALTYPDEFFDWIVAFESLSRLETRDEMIAVLGEVCRVLKPGGRLYVAVPGIPGEGDGVKARGYAGDSGLIPSFTPQTLEELLEEAGLAPAERPSAVLEGGQRFVRAIYRKPERQPSEQASR